MQAYTRELKTLFLKHAHPKNAAPMRRYMRDQFEYVGLKHPEFTALLRRHIAAHGLPPLGQLDIILRDLWALPQREFQYAAVGLLARLETHLPAAFIRTLEYLIVTKSWWDTVDTIATGTLAVHFRRYPKVRDRTLAKWRKSKNFWLRRACILFQLNYKHDTDFGLMQDIIRENLGSNEFFINKAIGWALRQHTRVDPQGVRRFVAETPLHPLSAREALKWLAKREQRSAARSSRPVKILLFLHGTLIMHRSALGMTREQRVQQSAHADGSLRDFASYVPCEDAVRKVQAWAAQDAQISYLSSHRLPDDVEIDRAVLRRYGFPDGPIFHRSAGETYARVVERTVPDVLVEDDCESIGGEPEMVFPHLRPELQSRVRSVVVKEFGGLADLPEDVSALAAP